jgi:hypothetical protein
MYTYFNAFHQHANTEIHTLTAKDDFRIVEVSGSNPLCSTKMPEIVEFTTFSGIFVAINRLCGQDHRAFCTSLRSPILAKASENLAQGNVPKTEFRGRRDSTGRPI